MTKLSGIYRITNTVTNESYIGKSKDIEGRLAAHKDGLRKGTHINKGLQEDYDLTEAIFPEFQIYVYKIIKEVEESELDDEEIKLIEEYNSFKKGYNRTKGGKYDKYKGLDEFGGERLLSTIERRFLIERELIKYLNSLDINSMNETEKKEYVIKLLKKIETMNRYSRFGTDIYFDKIKEIDPNNKDVWYYKAEYLLKSYNDDEESLECINKSIELNPENEKNWYIKAECLKRFRRYEEALKFNKKAIEFDPFNESYWLQKAECSKKIGDVEGTLLSYDKAIEINPNDYRNWYLKAGYLRSLGRNEDAIKIFKKLIKIDPLRKIGFEREIEKCFEKKQPLKIKRIKD